MCAQLQARRNIETLAGAMYYPLTEAERAVYREKDGKVPVILPVRFCLRTVDIDESSMGRVRFNTADTSQQGRHV